MRDDERLHMGLAWNAGRTRDRKMLENVRAKSFGADSAADARTLKRAGAPESVIDDYIADSMRNESRSRPWQ